MIAAARFLLIINLFLFQISKAGAQEVTMEETLNYINGKFGNVCQIDILRGVLTARFYDGPNIYREDLVLCKALNIASLNYDKEHRMLTIDCNGGTKCVDRQLFVRKIQRDYNRISFPVTLDARSEAGMNKAFNHMINLVLDPKYSSSEPFE